MTDANLYDLILKLTQRIERLEKIVQSNPLPDVPATNLTEWINNCIITEEDIEMAYENNGHIRAMRNCILRNHETSPLPILFHKNKLYVYETDTWEKWCNTTHLHILVRDVWRKFLKLHMNTPPDLTLEEDMRDLQRKRILEMRQQIYEVKKNRADMYRWIMKIDS